jgi:hypothetical protein
MRQKERIQRGRDRWERHKRGRDEEEEKGGQTESRERERERGKNSEDRQKEVKMGKTYIGGEKGGKIERGGKKEGRK